MTQTLKKFWPLCFLLGLACAHTSEEPTPPTQAQKFASMNPEERHIWLPPSEEELEARRQRQKRLDVLAADLERLFMGYADILGSEIILENLIHAKEPAIQQLEAHLDRQQAEKEQRVQELNRVLQEMEGSVQDMNASLEGLRRERIPAQRAPVRKQDDYRLAILLFRNGQYLESIAKFKSILAKSHPPQLKDNILFGLASNYYKLKQYDPALENLSVIILNHPKGDKWLVSHAMTGLIYNLRGQPDQAVPVLESALRQNPNPELLGIIQRLLKWAKEGTSHASS